MTTRVKIEISGGNKDVSVQVIERSRVDGNDSIDESKSKILKDGESMEEYIHDAQRIYIQEVGDFRE